MNQRTWHKGPPPHIGWWNASIDYKTSEWRWWNGRHWSWFVMEHYDAKTAAKCAQVKSEITTLIEWTNYWPENARVPRIKP